MKAYTRQIEQSEEVNLLWKISQKLSWMMNRLCCTTTTTTTTIGE